MNTLSEKVLGIKEKCIVEMIYLYDCREGLATCNGQILSVLGDDEDIFAELIKRKFIKKVCALAQCSDKDIVFIDFNFEEFAKSKVGRDGYESSDFFDGSYDDLVSFCEQHGYPKANEFRTLAKGIKEMENDF